MDLSGGEGVGEGHWHKVDNTQTPYPEMGRVFLLYQIKRICLHDIMFATLEVQLEAELPVDPTPPTMLPVDL